MEHSKKTITFSEQELLDQGYHNPKNHPAYEGNRITYTFSEQELLEQGYINPKNHPAFEGNQHEVAAERDTGDLPHKVGQATVRILNDER